MKSIISNIQKRSPMEHMSPLAGQSKSARKTLNTSLMLTPLVDAFAILVIYLLVQSTGASNIENIDGKMKLPKATYSDLLQNGMVIKVKNNKYFLKDVELKGNDILHALNDYSLESSKKGEQARLTIVADKKTAYEVLNPLMEWSSEYGIQNIQFAVYKKGGGV